MFTCMCSSLVHKVSPNSPRGLSVLVVPFLIVLHVARCRVLLEIPQSPTIELACAELGYRVLTADLFVVGFY